MRRSRGIDRYRSEAIYTASPSARRKKKTPLPGLGYARIMQVACILVKDEREIGCMKIHC